jgi:hypothetical protein
MNDDETKQLRLIIERQVAIQKDWRLPLRNGVLQGLGAAVGATLVISLVLWALKPLERIDALKPVLERISQALEKK